MYLAFFLAAGVLTITAGLDTALVLRTATVDGPRHAVLAALGISLGLLVWGAAVAFGLGALLAASELGYTILKYVGATYLGWLGIKLLRAPGHTVDLTSPTAHAPPRVWLVRGLLGNLLNPKVGVFYVTFLPQFIPNGADVAATSFLLTCIHVAQGIAWFALLIAAALPLRRTLTKPSVVRALDRLTGAVFLAFGAKLALSRR